MAAAYGHTLTFTKLNTLTKYTKTLTHTRTPAQVLTLL